MDVVDDEAIRGARIRIEKEAQRLDLIINNVRPERPECPARRF